MSCYSKPYPRLIWHKSIPASPYCILDNPLRIKSACNGKSSTFPVCFRVRSPVYFRANSSRDPSLLKYYVIIAQCDFTASQSVRSSYRSRKSCSPGAPPDPSRQSVRPAQHRRSQRRGFCYPSSPCKLIDTDIIIIIHYNDKYVYYTIQLCKLYYWKTRVCHTRWIRVNSFFFPRSFD